MAGDGRSIRAGAAGWLPAVLVLVGGCGAGQPTACPAVAWGNTLTVTLTDDWPVGMGRSLEVDCGSPCEPASVGRAAGPVVAASLRGTSADVSFILSSPDTVVVTVLDADGATLAEVEADLDWVRVGGSEECGGPGAVSVVVPAP
jgi:hypothetical protein